MFPISSLNQIGASGGTGTGLLEDVSTRTLKSASVGQNAGKLSTGTGNAFVGYEAGRANRAGSYDTFIGYQAGAENASSSYCTFVGALAGRQNQRGTGSVFVGYSAGEFNADGVECVGIGAYAMRENVSGNRCVAIGYRAGERLLNGDFNTMVGAESGQDNRSGNYNTVVGYRAGRALFQGDENTFTGAFAGYSNAFGSGNAFVGFRAGIANEGDFNTIVGAHAGKDVKGNTNVIVGYESALYLQGDASVVIGTRSALDLRYGSSNVFLGSGANSYFASNTHSICIGTRNTRAMSYGVAVGEDIETRRQGTVSVGFNIQSDADNSIILGNDININSVINFNNVLQYNLRNISAEDGFAKFGICNILYTDFLQLSNLAPFPVAQSGAYTSNILSSLTNKAHGTLSPSSYDLRQVMPSHYIHSGIGIGLFVNQSAGATLLTNAELASRTHISSNLTTVPSMSMSPNPSSIHFADALRRGALDAAVAFNGGESDVVVNVLKYNQTSATIPISIAKGVQRPILVPQGQGQGQPQGGGFQASVRVNPLSNVVLSGTSNTLNIMFDGNGITSNVFDSDKIQLQTYVTESPAYGVITPLIFHPSNVSTLTYKPYPQFAFQPVDDFHVTPSLNIDDANGARFSLMTDSNLAITLDRSSNILYTTPLHAFSNLETRIGRHNAQQIPYNFSSDVPVRFTYIPNNTYVIYDTQPQTRQVYSSNDIVTMVNENIIDYPDEIKWTLLDGIQGRVDAYQISLADSRSNLLYPIASNIQSNVYALSDKVEALGTIPNKPRIKIDYRQVVTNYTAVRTTSILQDTDILTTGFSNAWTQFNVSMDAWMVNYKPSLQTYAPTLISTTNDVTSNIALFTKSLFEERRWVVEREFQLSYTDLLTAAEDANSLRSSSNVIMQSVKLYPHISIYDAATGLLDDYNTWFRKYYELPRLFLTYSDILNSRLAFQTHRASSYTASRLDDHVSLQLLTNSNVIQIPYHHYPFSSQWMLSLNSNIAIQGAITNHINGGVVLPKLTLPSLPTSNVFIKEYPIYGTLSTLTSNVHATNLNHMTLAWHHPRIQGPHSFEVVAVNASNQAKSFDVTVNVEPISYFHPMYAPYFTPRRLTEVTNAYVPTYTTVQLANTTFVTSNISSTVSPYAPQVTSFNIVNPLASYNQNTGIFTTTSNVSITYTLSSVVGNAGQTNYDIINTSINSVTRRFLGTTLQNVVTQSYTSSASYEIPNATQTRTIQKTENINVDIVQSFVYTSNIVYHSNTHHYADYWMYEGLNSSRAPQFLYETSNMTFELSSNMTLTKYTGTSPSLTMVSFSNLTVTSNVDFFDTYYRLTPYIFYDDQQFHTWAPENNNSMHIVKIGTGVAQSFSNQDVLAGNMFIKVPPSTQNVKINQLSAAMNVVPQILTTKPTNASLDKRVFLSHSNISTIDGIFPTSEYSTLPANSTRKLHIVSSSNGVFLSEHGAYNSTFDITSTQQRSKIRYMPIDTSTTTDEIQYHYIEETGGKTIITSNVLCKLNYERRPAPYGKLVNVGIDQRQNSSGARYQPYVLKSSEFNLVTGGVASSSMYIRLTEANGVRLRFTDSREELGTGVPFLYQDVRDGRIGIEMDASCNATLRYRAYDAPIYDNDHALLNKEEQRFDIYGISFQDYPTLALHDVSQLRIDQYLDPNNTSNIVSGNLWGHVNTFVERSYPMDPDDLQCIVTRQPEKGFMALRGELSVVPISSFTQSNILNNEVIYVPYEPSAAGLSNDTVAIRLVNINSVGGDWSSSYEMQVKNYAAFYSPKVWDSTKRMPYQRLWRANDEVELSAGLVQDGYVIDDGDVFSSLPYSSNALAATAVPITILELSGEGQGQDVWRTGDVELTTAPQSKPPHILSNIASVVMDAADRTSFSNLLFGHSHGIVSYDGLTSKSIYVIVIQPPKNGVVLNTSTRQVVSHFTEAELADDSIHYQHIGSNAFSDSMTFHIGSHEYDVRSQPMTLNINIRPLPRIILNVKDYIYELTSNAALENIQDIRSGLGVSSGYLHVLSNQHIGLRHRSSSNIQGFISKVELDTNHVGASVQPSLFTDTGISSAGYEEMFLDLVPNNFDVYHINPIVHEPLYKPLFAQRWINYFNRYESSNIDISPHAATSNQVIQYDFNRQNANFLTNVIDRAVTVSLQVKPLQNLTFASGTTSFIQTESLRNYRYDFIFYSDEDEDNVLLLFEVYHTHVIVRSSAAPPLRVEIPEHLQFVYGEWNNIQFIDYDINNNNNLSLYLQFDASQFQAVNNSRNILYGLSISSVEFNQLARFQIRTNIYDPANFVGNIRESRSVTGSSHEALDIYFSLQDYTQTLQVQNLIFATSTFSRNFDAFEDYDPATYNVTIGKQILVKGNNNICLGTEFSTSGTNSIIIGNTIGTVASGTNNNNVSDIYESIIIGNNSFKNAFIRDMISIGNEQFNDLFEGTDDTIADKLNKYLSKRPIVIGNNIDKSKLDFEVNIANVFLKTSEGGEKVFLGNNGEQVAIGFSCNVDLSSEYLVHVNGSVDVKGPLRFTTRNMETINQQMSSATSVYSSAGAGNLGAIIQWTSPVAAAQGGLIKTVRILATLHLIRDDQTYAYRKFEGLINCVDDAGATPSPTPRLSVTLDSKTFVTPNAFTGLVHNVTRSSDRSVLLRFDWIAGAGVIDYEATLHIEAYAPLDMGTFQFTSYRA